MSTDLTPRVVDVQEFIDSQPSSAVQRLLLFLCFLVVAIDGFDTAIIGFIAPAIRAEWVSRSPGSDRSSPPASSV